MNRKLCRVRLAIGAAALLLVAGATFAGVLDPISAGCTAVGAAVAVNQTVRRSGACRRSSNPVAASKKLYEGTLAFADGSTGYLTDVIASGANRFAGVMVEEADNSAGAAGDIHGEYWTDGEFVLKGSGFTQADAEKVVYATDNYTVTLTSTDNVEVGVIRKVLSATEILVAINAKA